LRVVVWVKKFLLGRSQRFRVDRQLSEELRVMSGVTQGSVVGLLLFPVYVEDIWKNVATNIRLFADDCIIYRKIKDSSDIDNLQTYLNRLEELTAENEIKIIRGKRKAARFKEDRLKERIRCYFGDQLIREASKFKYLNCADHVNYTLRRA